MPADPALATVAESVLRLEYKIDLLMHGLGVSGALPPMHFLGHTCPVCKQLVDYQVDIQQQVVKRLCGCKTGKQPSVIPLFPVTGTSNGPAANATAGTDAGDTESPASDSSRSKKR